MPWLSRMRVKERTRLRGSIGLPVRVVSTRPVSAPGGAEFHLVGFLLLLASEQCTTCKADQGEITAACPGLDRADAQLPLRAVDLLADVDDLSLNVNVLPA
jgi:hypothetical protein